MNITLNPIIVFGLLSGAGCFYAGAHASRASVGLALSMYGLGASFAGRGLWLAFSAG